MTEATLRKQALACILLIIHTGIAGQVGIGTTSPNQSSILDVSSTTKGVLIPRMTMSQRTALSNPSDGLTVYQTDDAKGFYFFNGSMWLKLTNAIPSDQLTTNNYRSIQIFDTPGTYTWEVPTGVTKIIAELWGGGGGTGGNGGNYSLYTLGGWVNGTGGTGAVGGERRI